MEETEKIDPHYKQGFNEGYIIAKHLPDLSENLSHVKSNAPRVAGIHDGGKQFILEQTRERHPAWLKGNRPGKAHKKDKTQEKDKE